MQELFRFYAVRAADAVPDYEQVKLETTSGFQTAIRDRSATAAAITSACKAVIDSEGNAVRQQLATWGAAVQKFAARMRALKGSNEQAPVDKWVQEDFGESLPALVEKLATTTDFFKDTLVAMRILRVAPGSNPIPIIARTTSPTPSAVNLPPTPADLMLHLRIRTAVARAYVKPQTYTAMKHAPAMALTFDALDRIVGIIKAFSPPPNEVVDQHRQVLQGLTQLILEIRQACPFALELSPPPPDPTKGKVDPPAKVVLAGGLVGELQNRYSTLLGQLSDLPGPAIDLTAPYADLHPRLEAKALAIQQLIDSETPAVPVPQAAPATSPTIGGHMQLAGVADVHVVLNHVVDYRQAEIAQIENILLGEQRERTYRTLLRSEQETENTTETTTTQEREVKTEDRSDLKTETDASLKEVLDIKAGLNAEYKQGDSLKLSINASVGYNRTKEETTKVATEFAKDITNRAAQKVVQLVRQSVKTKLLNETEETVKHSFDNSGSERTDNISGIYQWIEKIYENVHLTVGGPAAIFDGIVLQPAQRILAAPPAADGALGSVIPPPPLDIDPSAIHPWNYLSLAARFGASGVTPPPPFITNTSFSAGTADTNPQGVAHDIALPDDAVAAWAVVIWDAQDKGDDTPNNADARASIGTHRLVSVIMADHHAVQSETLVLAGERTLLPFAGLFYDAIGYELTIDVTCVRTLEAYQRWQLNVFAALASARDQAQQAYDEKVARAALQSSYDYAPSPGRVEELIREELKRCAIGVLAKQVAGQNIFQRIGNLYANGPTDEIARLCLIYEHAFAWENMSYILYPYFWADSRNNGWDLHTAKSENDENWAAFLRAGAARVVVPVRDGFVRMEALGIPDPDLPPNGPKPNPLQMLQEDVDAILDETLTFDDLLSISSSKALSSAKESALRAEVMSKWVEHEHWFLRTPTELVRLRPLDAKLPTWTWNKGADLSQGIADAWKNAEEDTD